MIIRIVKMTFQPGKVEDFLNLFNEKKEKIAGFEGCHYVELLKDVDQQNVFFTYSKWSDQRALEKYRHSELFTKTWAKTKKLFADKPKAWSLQSFD